MRWYCGGTPASTIQLTVSASCSRSKTLRCVSFACGAKNDGVISQHTWYIVHHGCFLRGAASAYIRMDAGRQAGRQVDDVNVLVQNSMRFHFCVLLSIVGELIIMRQNGGGGGGGRGWRLFPPNGSTAYLCR